MNYSYNRLNQLTARTVSAGPDAGTWTYIYDNNGNMTLEKKGTVEKRYFHYNFDDRMTNVEVNYAEVYEFEYDAKGRLLIRTDNDHSQRLWYYDDWRVILEKTRPDDEGTFTTAKVYTLDKSELGHIISERRFSGVNYVDLWYHYDRLGNVMDLTDVDGMVSASFEQEAFGNVLEGEAEGRHLTTKEFDSDIGLYYFGARWYDPELGRFTQKDPILKKTIISGYIKGFLLSLNQIKTNDINLYIFTSNNPINLIDYRGGCEQPPEEPPGWPEPGEPPAPTDDCAKANIKMMNSLESGNCAKFAESPNWTTCTACGQDWTNYFAACYAPWTQAMAGWWVCKCNDYYESAASQ